jgi:hypothetical protein
MRKEPPLSKRLLVEGAEDFRVIPEFLEKSGIVWGERKDRHKWPAELIDGNGIDEILKPGVISTESSTPGIQIFGIIVDADDSVPKRWHNLRQRLVTENPSEYAALPDSFPTEGLIADLPSGLRFGVWIMPDNQSPGMMETFLAHCVGDLTQGLWPHVKEFCHVGKTTHSAPYIDEHRAKAEMHSWLAVQNPPGKQLHDAVKQKILQVGNPIGVKFVAWIKTLFQLS